MRTLNTRARLQEAISYEEWHTQRTNIMRQVMHHASSGANPNASIMMAENHHRARTNAHGEPVLPNGVNVFETFLTTTVLHSHMTMARRVPAPKSKARGGAGGNDPQEMLRRMMVRHAVLVSLPAQGAEYECG